MEQIVYNVEEDKRHIVAAEENCEVKGFALETCGEEDKTDLFREKYGDEKRDWNKEKSLQKSHKNTSMYFVVLSGANALGAVVAHGLCRCLINICVYIVYFII